MKRQALWVARAAALTIGISLGAGFALAQDGPMPPAPAPAAKPATDKPPATPRASGDPSATGASHGAAPAAAGTPVAAPAPTDTQAAPAPGDPASSTTKIMVPSGTHIPLVLHNAISTRSARPGDPVYFETLYPVMIDGKVVIPAGSYVSGEVTESKRPGRVKGRGELAIKMTNMILPNAYQVNMNATPTGAGTGGGETTNSEGVIVGDSDKKDDAATIAKTTAAGAGIGGVTARSPAGAGIGAAAGAAVGLAAVLLTRGPDAELPRGSTVEAVINRSLYLDADKITFTSPGKASDLPGPPNREPVRSTSPF
jgi:hypothetical protein